MNKYRLVEIKDFNKVNQKFPKTLIVLLAYNGRWFPLLGNFASLHALVAEKLLGETPVLVSDNFFSFTVTKVKFLKNCIKIFTEGDGNFTFTMGDEFTCKELTARDLKLKTLTYKDWYKNNSEKIKNLGIYSEIYKYFT